MFAKSGVIIETISEQITSAGEKALLHFNCIKRTDNDNLDSLRSRMFCRKVASSRFHISQKFSRQHLQLQNITRFGYFTKLGSEWVKTLVRLSGDGGSRMNRCNQRRQILDVHQVNCYHQLVVTVKQVVRHFDAVAESMDLSVLLPVKNVGD